MVKQERCYCKDFHCESTVEKIGDDYILSQNERFRFVKENGVITDEIIVRGVTYKGGITDGAIADCPIRRDLVKRGVNPEKRPKYK